MNQPICQPTDTDIVTNHNIIPDTKPLLEAQRPLQTTAQIHSEIINTKNIQEHHKYTYAPSNVAVPSNTADTINTLQTENIISPKKTRHSHLKSCLKTKQTHVCDTHFKTKSWPTGVLPKTTIRWKPQNMVQWKHFELEKQGVTYDQERNNIEHHMDMIRIVDFLTKYLASF